MEKKGKKREIGNEEKKGTKVRKREKERKKHRQGRNGSINKGGEEVTSKKERSKKIHEDIINLSLFVL